MADPMAGSVRLIGEVMGLPVAPQPAWLVMLLVAGEMAGISPALGPAWPWIDRGIEYPVLIGCLALYMAVRGGGHYALDRK